MREKEFSNEICSSAAGRFGSQACRAAGNHRYRVNPTNYSTAESQSDSAVLFLFIVTCKARKVITLFLCLKNRKPLKGKPITWDGDGSERKVKRPAEGAILGQIQMPGRKSDFKGQPGGLESQEQPRANGLDTKMVQVAQHRGKSLDVTVDGT